MKVFLKIQYFFIAIFFAIQLYAQKQEKTSNPFQKGEKLDYKLHWGFINAGNASIKVDDNLFKVNDKISYKISVNGWSSSFLNIGFKIKDSWTTYVDTSSFTTLKSIRDIEEGRYLLHEEVLYDYYLKNALISRKHPDKEKEELVKTIPGFVADIVSGFFELRKINFNNHRVGDTLSLKVFFDKENYIFKVRYMGKGTVKTEVGKYKAFKLVPVMPKNRLFDGEESIKAWISDDGNKIPLMAEVEMFVGSVKLELTGFKNLLHPMKAER